MTTETKRSLAASLVSKLKEKPLEKITIQDICKGCHVNRQTFYYHFHDIYDLVEWIYTNEARNALGIKKTHDTWEEGFLRIFSYAQKEKDFILSTYHSIGRDYLETFLYKETYQILYDVIDELGKDSGILECDKALIADFYKYAFVGVVLDWVKRGMHEDPSYIVSRIHLLMDGNFMMTIERFVK